LLLAVFGEADHLGDPCRALFGPAPGGVDPAQVGGAVGLGQVVDERGRLRGRVQCRVDVGREVAALGAFGFEDHVHRRAIGRPAAPVLRRPEGQHLTVVVPGDDASELAAIE
jgi:hypothetical protein